MAEAVAKHQLVRAVVVAHQLVQVKVEGVAHAELADAHRRVWKKHKALAAAVVKVMLVANAGPPAQVLVLAVLDEADVHVYLLAAVGVHLEDKARLEARVATAAEGVAHLPEEAEGALRLVLAEHRYLNRYKVRQRQTREELVVLVEYAEVRVRVEAVLLVYRVAVHLRLVYNLVGQRVAVEVHARSERQLTVERGALRVSVALREWDVVRYRRLAALLVAPAVAVVVQVGAYADAALGTRLETQRRRVRCLFHPHPLLLVRQHGVRALRCACQRRVKQIVVEMVLVRYRVLLTVAKQTACQQPAYADYLLYRIHRLS